MQSTTEINLNTLVFYTQNGKLKFSMGKINDLFSGIIDMYLLQLYRNNLEIDSIVKYIQLDNDILTKLVFLNA